MRTIRMAAVAGAALILGTGLALNVAQSQQPGVKRTDLLRHDLGVAGREVVQVRVELAPGVAFPPHSHPGEEIAYVIEGELEYRLEGRPPVTLEAGEALFIPAGRSTRRGTSAASARRSSPRTSSRRASRSSRWPSERHSGLSKGSVETNRHLKEELE
jgi:quercetin dioxygenase-like cupin family protein